jgi:coenzyme F420-reducing hydrogenase delta subunit
MTVKGSYEPKILGFLCNWCCYAAADSAGISLFAVEAFSAGVDGLFVGG